MTEREESHEMRNAHEVDIKDPDEKDEENPIQKHKELRNRVEEIIAQSTINGLSQAFATTDRRYRLVWTLLFVVSIFIFTYNFYSITVVFLDEPILTQLDPNYIPFTWPHFTVCNPTNPIPFSLDKNLEPKWKQLMKNFKKNYTLSPFGFPRNQRIIWDHYIGMSSLNPQEFFANGLRGSIQSLVIDYKESTIASSSGDFDQYMRVKEPLKDIFFVTLDSLRCPMPCYTLAPERVEEISGSAEGLLSIKVYLEMDFKSHNIYNPGYESRKMYLYITHPNASIETTTPKFIYAGTDTHLTIKESTLRRKKNCRTKVFEIKKYDIDLATTRSFTGNFDDCRFHLSQSLFVKECGCYNPYLPLYVFDNVKPRVCTNMSIYDNKSMDANILCLNRILSQSESYGFEKQLNETCGEFRKQVCKSITYTVIRDTNSWSSVMSNERRRRLRMEIKSVFKNAPKNATEEFVGQNLAILNLHWNKEPTTATYEDFEYPVSQFLSDIGGIAGLWLGISVISIFELVDIFAHIVKFLIIK